jgi:PEP-CTERM motif-containing protein
MTSRIFTAVVVVMAGVADVTADPIRFIPATDPDGRVYSINENDGWGDGRGVVLTARRPVVLSSVSLFHDLTGLDLAYEVTAVGGSEGRVTDGQTILRAGARTITTSGLEFIPFAFEPLQLVAGNSYHIEFSFNGSGNQNFFHNNCASFSADDPNTCFGGQVPYSVGPFANVDGTHIGKTENFVQPAVMVEVAEVAPVPEPATIVLFGTGVAAATARRLRMRQHRARQPQ